MSIFNKSNNQVHMNGYSGPVSHIQSGLPAYNIFDNGSKDQTPHIEKDKVIKKLDEILGRSDNNTWNIYNNTPQIIKHSSIIARRTMDTSKDIPLYIKIGKSVCNSCKIEELIHGFHYPENVDLCNKCFSLASNIQDKSNWIEFNAE
jgi:hypothetical protein